MKSASLATRRRLAAIVCADVAGYSRLMRQDEAATLRLLAAYRGITDRLIAAYGGRIANTAGDSILAEFPSAADALHCSLGIQEQIAASNEWVSPAHRMAFRIGLHVGEALERGGDLFGDDVNVAARMQEIARPGSICASEAACHYLRRSLPASFEDLGPQKVKNIETPIRAFLVHSATPPAARAFPPIHRMEFYLARRFHAVCAAAMGPVARPEGLQPIDTAALASIHESPGIDEPQLAERLGIAPARARRVVARLREHDLLARPSRQPQSRTGALHLSPDGLGALQRLLPAVRSAVERVLAPLSTEERETLKDLLARIVGAHDVGSGTASRRSVRR